MKTQKLFTLLATTALLVPTFSNGVSALEEVTQDISTQEVVATPEETIPQTETTTEPKQETNVEDTIATLPNPAPTPTLARVDSSLIPRAISASGTWGTAPWTFTDDGVLTVGAGELGDYLGGGAVSRPCNNDDIKEVEFTGTVTLPSGGGATGLAGEALLYMFSGCHNLREIRGIEKMDVSNAATLCQMFEEAGLETLDLSHWDTSGMEDGRMALYFTFSLCSNLKALNLSSFDTTNLSGKSINGTFYGDNKLQYLTLGEKTIFSNGYGTELPGIDTSGIYNGWWGNLATGQVYTSSDDFMNNYDGSSPGTYEWVKKSYNVSCTLNGGTTTESLPTSYFPDTETSLPEVTKADAVFAGWFDADGTKWENIPVGTIGDLALTAKFQTAPSIEANDIAPKIQKGASYQWKIDDHAPAYYNEYGEKTETPFYAKLNGKIYDQNDTVELAEGTYEVEITNERPLTRGAAVTTTAKITITSTDPTPDAGGNTNNDQKELENKILDITKDYNLSDEAQNNIAKELEEKAKNGTLSLDDIKQIIQKYAPNLSASQQEELAEKLYKLLYPNSPLLPSTNETKQAGLTLLGVGLVGLGITVFWIKRKRKI